MSSFRSVGWTIVGTLLPICCWGTLPIAVGFYKKGARLGPILAFLVATPATSISALFVTYAILGFHFAAYIFFAVILMGVVMGMIGNLLPHTPRAQMAEENCPHCSAAAGTCGPACSWKGRMMSVLRYAYIEMPREIGKETLIGIFLAAFVAAYVPLGELIHRFLSGGLGYLFSVVFGLLTYICSTATVPLTDALIKQGLGVGAGMTLMLLGPVTSYGTILVLKKEFGLCTLIVYLSTITAMSLALGYLFSIF
jgi:uncharacterized membrane protein YraQ (UPF0718 family)